MSKLKQTLFRINNLSNNLIAISLVWIVVWLIIINVWKVSIVSTISSATQLDSLWSLWVLQLPLIIGCFILAYGIGIKAKETVGTVAVTIFGGIFLVYILTIPIIDYINFVRYFL